MSEQYELAAWRHLRTAEMLFNANEFDDAGYHSGVAGENIVKALLQKAGLESYWTTNGINLRHTPMRGHFPTLHSLIVAAQADVTMIATGRHAAAASATLLDPSFNAMFSGWSIDIRYADTTCTPVAGASCQRWLDDASTLILNIAT